MTVVQMQAEITRLSDEISTLKKDIATIKQLLAQSKSSELVDESYSLIYEIQNAINAFDSRYAGDRISDPATLSRRESWVKTLQNQLQYMENFGYRRTKAFWDVKACERLLIQLESDLLSKEVALQQLRLGLNEEESPKYNFFAFWKKQKPNPIKTTTIAQSPKSPVELMHARKDNQLKVDKFRREPLFANIQSTQLAPTTHSIVQQYRRH